MFQPVRKPDPALGGGEEEGRNRHAPPKPGSGDRPGAVHRPEPRTSRAAAAFAPARCPGPRSSSWFFFWPHHPLAGRCLPAHRFTSKGPLALPAFPAPWWRPAGCPGWGQVGDRLLGGARRGPATALIGPQAAHRPAAGGGP